MGSNCYRTILEQLCLQLLLAIKHLPEIRLDGQLLHLSGLLCQSWFPQVLLNSNQSKTSIAVPGQRHWEDCQKGGAIIEHGSFPADIWLRCLWLSEYVIKSLFSKFMLNLWTEHFLHHIMCAVTSTKKEAHQIQHLPTVSTISQAGLRTGHSSWKISWRPQPTRDTCWSTLLTSLMGTDCSKNQSSQAYSYAAYSPVRSNSP